jgi:hypothetical protein
VRFELISYQSTELSRSIPLDRISTIGSHKSYQIFLLDAFQPFSFIFPIYNNDGVLEKNQLLSITEQLDLGIRWLGTIYIHECAKITDF